MKKKTLFTARGGLLAILAMTLCLSPFFLRGQSSVDSFKKDLNATLKQDLEKTPVVSHQKVMWERADCPNQENRLQHVEDVYAIYSPRDFYSPTFIPAGSFHPVVPTQRAIQVNIGIPNNYLSLSTSTIYKNDIRSSLPTPPVSLW